MEIPNFVLRSSVDNASVVTSVMGGFNAQVREFPFQVGLYYDENYLCGGSVIGTMFILTAAHCVYNLSPEKFKVTAGDHNRMLDEGTEQIRRVSQIFVHEGYTRTTLDHDIALMVLSQPLVFNQNVGRIKILPGPATHSGLATVSGWGQLQHGASSHHILQKVDVPIISVKSCQAAFNTKYKISVTDDSLCAGGNGKDACRGDSGGPLSARVEAGEGQYLVGVVSWGVPCIDSDMTSVPGVYVNVSKYSKWIDETLLKYGRESGKCQNGEFYCAIDDLCIFSSWVCDGDRDCSDGIDESQKLCELPCPQLQFQCPGGKCISQDWICDGRSDCSGGIDERNCTTCKPGAVLCTSEEGKCISETSLCDGNLDCRNGEDERNCKACHGRGFHCTKDEKCIPWKWRCDSEQDCSDGKDEAKCACLFGLCLNKIF